MGYSRTVVFERVDENVLDLLERGIPQQAKFGGLGSKVLKSWLGDRYWRVEAEIWSDDQGSVEAMYNTYLLPATQEPTQWAVYAREKEYSQQLEAYYSAQKIERNRARLAGMNLSGVDGFVLRYSSGGESAPMDLDSAIRQAISKFFKEFRGPTIVAIKHRKGESLRGPEKLLEIHLDYS